MVSKFHEANQLARMGDLEGAVVAYRLVLEENSGIDQAYHNLGETLFKLERWDEAIAAFQQALAINPRARLSHFCLGEVFAKCQQWTEALESYQEAIELQLHQPEVWCALGVARMSLGFEDEAFEAHQKAIEIILHQRGASPINQGQIREAIGNWQALLDKYPVDVPARVYLHLNRTYRRMMDYGVAETILQQGKERYPDGLDWVGESAKAALSQPDGSEILSYWKEFLDLYPRKASARAYLFMSLAQAHIKDYAAAENLLLNGKQAYANFLDWVAEYAGVIMSQGDWQESLQPWQYLLDIFLDKASANVYMRMSRVYCSLGRYSHGEQILLKGIENYSDVAELTYKYIQIAMFKQNWSEAIERCQDLLDRDPEKAPAKIYLWMGRSYANRGDYEVAETVILQAREKYPNSIELACEYPQISMLEQNWSEAIERCQDLLDTCLGKVPAKVYLWMSQAWANSGDYEKAEIFILKGREKYPNSIELACESAQIAMSQQNWSEVVQRCQAVLDTYPEKATAKIYVFMSMACAQIEDYVAAEALLLQGRQEYPNLLDLAGEYAEVVKAEGDRSENLARWRDMLDIDRGTAPKKAYLLLSRKYCKNGNYAEAETIILKGRSRYPDSWELASEYAQIAMYQQDWSEAIAGWNHVLDTYPEQAPSSVYVQLNQAYRAIKDYIAAENIIIKGREKYPNVVDLAYEYGYIAWSQRDYLEAIERWQDLLDTFSVKAPAKVYARMSLAYRSLGDYEAAEKIILRGMERYSHSVELAYGYAEIAITQGNWQDAIQRLQSILDIYKEKTPPKAYFSLSQAYRLLEDLDSAEQIIRKGLEQYPDFRQLLSEYAELAMVRRNWTLACQRWQAFIGELSEEQMYHAFPTLPLRSKTDDFLDCHWQDFANYCASKIDDDASNPPSVSLLFVLIDVLIKTDYEETADLICKKALTQNPNHLPLYLCYAELSMRCHQWEEALYRWSMIIKSFGNQAPFSVFLKLNLAQFALRNDEDCFNHYSQDTYNQDNLYDQELISELRKNERILNSYKKINCIYQEMPVYLIHYDPETLLGYQIEYADFFLTSEKIGDLISCYHRQKTGSISNAHFFDYSVKVAYRVSRRFAFLYQRQPEMHLDMLAEAVFYDILTEVSTVLPLKRLAKRIAQNNLNKPIFIQLSSDKIFYLARFGSWSISTLTPFYLYYFLKRNGANVFLCLRKEHSTNLNADNNDLSIKFVPSLFWSNAFQEYTKTENQLKARQSNSAIVLDTIRGIDKNIMHSEMHIVRCPGIYLSEEYDVAGTYGKVRVKGKKINKSKFSIDLYNDGVLPKEFIVNFHRVENLVSRSKGFDQKINSIMVSKNQEINLLESLNDAMSDTLFNMAKQAHSNVKKHKISQLHICEVFRREARIMAHAVKQAGGKITLWPHSANPFYTYLQSDKIVDQAYCLTRTGANIWHLNHPRIPVSLIADSMLPFPTRKLKTDLNNNQTIVIIGNPLYRLLMPFYDLDAYYENFNIFLDCLFKVEDIDVMYKPKNNWYSSISWFSKIANKYSKNWKVIGEIPLEINYPNMIFITIGMGSTALLEGMSRGIPAMIVRGFEVNCYTTIDNDVVKTGTPEFIIDEIIKCKDYRYREKLIDEQMEYYCREIGLLDRSSLLNLNSDPN